MGDNGLEKQVKKTKKKLATKKILRFIFLGCTSFVFTVYFFSLVVNMTVEIAGKYKEKDQLNNELSELKEKETELSTDVLKLQDPEYIARYLREKYYYSKDGEYVIKLPDNN